MVTLAIRFFSAEEKLENVDKVDSASAVVNPGGEETAETQSVSLQVDALVPETDLPAATVQSSPPEDESIKTDGGSVSTPELVPPADKGNQSVMVEAEPVDTSAGDSVAVLEKQMVTDEMDQAESAGEDIAHELDSKGEADLTEADLTTAADSIPEAEGNLGNLDDVAAFRELLEQRGWKTERDAGGSLILIPQAFQTPEVMEQPAPVEQPGQGEAGNDMEALRELLEQRGWKTERDADGSLILIPQAFQTPEVMEQPAPVEQPGQGEAGNDMEALRELLEQRGWETERDADGSLILIPRANLDQ